MGHHIGEGVAINGSGNTRSANHDSLSGCNTVLPVNCVWRRIVELVIVNELEMLVLGDVPVEPRGWKTANVRPGILELIVKPVEVIRRCDATLQRPLSANGRVDNIQAGANLRIYSSGKTLGSS